jgi:mannose-6-phosphate isomerase-like protein (cupin superfamily)
MPTVIDLDAEARKLVMFRGLRPDTKRDPSRGNTASLPPYRDGLLLLGKSAGTGHWETHPVDELVHVREGSATLDIVQGHRLDSLEVGAGMIVIVPPGLWHRFRSPDGKTGFSAVVPGDHLAAEVEDPLTVSGLDLGDQSKRARIVDLNAELAKLTMFHGRTPQTTFAERKGSAAIPAPYRDGFLLLSRWSGGKTHWEMHPADELVLALEGTVVLDVVEADGPKSYTLGPGTMTVMPRGTWHRFHSALNHTGWSLTLPSDHIDLDVDDPREAIRELARAAE